MLRIDGQRPDRALVETRDAWTQRRPAVEESRVGHAPVPAAVRRLADAAIRARVDDVRRVGSIAITATRVHGSLVTLFQLSPPSVLLKRLPQPPA